MDKTTGLSGKTFSRDRKRDACLTFDMFNIELRTRKERQTSWIDKEMTDRFACARKRYEKKVHAYTYIGRKYIVN